MVSAYIIVTHYIDKRRNTMIITCLLIAQYKPYTMIIICLLIAQYKPYMVIVLMSYYYIISIRSSNNIVGQTVSHYLI